MRCIRINSGQQRVAVQAIGEANTIRSLTSFRQSHEPTANEIVHRHNQIQQMISDDSVGVERQEGLVHYGIEDVFNSKPKLANAVYEILGHKNSEHNKKLIEIANKLKSKDRIIFGSAAIAMQMPYNRNIGDVDILALVNDDFDFNISIDKTKHWNDIKQIFPNAKLLKSTLPSYIDIDGNKVQLGYITKTTLNNSKLNNVINNNNSVVPLDLLELDAPQWGNKNDLLFQQKQQALEQYSQYIDSIYPSSTTGLLFKGLRKKGKGHNTPNHSWYSSEYWISDRHYNDGTGVRIFVADTRSLAEHELNTPDGVTPAKQQEEDFINNSYHDAIMLDTEDIGGRQIQYAIRKDIKLHEIGTEQDIEKFKEYINHTFDRQLAQKIQNKLERLYPEIKLQITNNPIWEKGENVYNQQVNYRLKTVEILLSDRAKQIFAKGEKAKWDLNKILTELAIPKEQKALLLDLGITDREQIALELASKYGFTVEIKTATIKEGSPHARNENEYPEFEYNGEYFTRQGGYFLKDTSPTFDNAVIIFTDEYFEALEKSGITATPSKYYSNLSAPGGIGRNKYEGNPDWEYQELEIYTPLITPSIKGHAQFATDNGIGWARVWYNKNTGVVEIQEIQSDLFQKGRGNDNLISKRNISYPEDINEIVNTYLDGQPITDKERELAINYLQTEDVSTKKFKENQFLQLLNKDNNWVTFFIKSIIQDSAKKGYEKVLFPKGETAAKVEGHETIADQIERINHEIKDYEQQLSNVDYEKLWASSTYAFGTTVIRLKKEDGFLKDGYAVWTNQEHNLTDKSILTNVHTYNKSGVQFTYIKEDLTAQFIQERKDYIIDRISRLEEQKSDLKSQGIEKLKPIEAFYEIKVGRILEKAFGKENIKTITDEYGNQWREVTINQARDLANILLQQNEANEIIGQANIKAGTVLIDAIKQKQDTLPHEYAHHYIAWFRNTSIVQEAIKKWGSEEALVQSIGEQVVKQKGEALTWYKKFVKWIMNQFNSLSNIQRQEITKILTDAFLTRQDLRTRSEEQVEKNEVDLIQEAANDKQNKIVEQRILTSQMQGVLDTYKSMFPNLNFIPENNETSSSNKMAWIDSKGVHYNIDLVTEATFAHEVSEVFLVLLKQTDIDAYNRIISETRRIVEENETAKKIEEFISKEYKLDNEAHWNEVASHLLENDTKLQMERFLLAKKLGTLSEIPGLVNSIHSIISFLKRNTPFYGKTIREYLREQIVQQRLSNDLLQAIDTPRYKLLRNRGETKLNYEIKNGIDFLKRWNHKIADNSSNLRRSSLEIAEDLYKRHGLGKKEFIIPGTKTRIVTENKTHQVIIDEIQQTYATIQYNSESTINNSFIEFVNKYKLLNLKEDKTKLIEDIYGDKASYESIYKLMMIMDIREDSEVMMYSDLAYSQDYSNLYDSAFDYKEQLQTIVIINKGKNGKYEISLFHLTNEYMDTLEDYSYIKNKSLVQNMGKYHYRMRKGNWQNNREGLSKGLIGLQILSLKNKLGDKMSLINGGIITGTGDRLESRTFYDFIDFFNHMKLIREDALNNPTLIVNPSIISVLENESLYNYENYEDDWVYRYGMYLKSLYERSADVYNNISAKVLVSKAQMLLGEIRPYQAKEILMQRVVDINKIGVKDNERVLKEKYMIGRAMMQLDRGWTSFMNNIKDVGNKEAFMVGLRNFGQDIIQWSVMHGDIASVSLIRRFNVLNDQFKKLAEKIRDSKSRFSSTRLRGPLMEVSGEYYSNMYKKGMYGIATTDMVIDGRKVNKGERIMINLPEMYHTQDDVSNGKITQEQKDLYDWFVKTANDLIVEVKLHDLQKSNPKATIVEAKALASTLTPGEMFVITQTANERLFSGDVAGAWERMAETGGFTEASSESEMDYDSAMKSIERHLYVINYFNDQIKDKGKREELIGLKRVIDDNGQIAYEVNSEQAYYANTSMSTDLQRAIQSFLKEMIRYKAYDEQVIPRLVLAEGMMNFLSVTNTNLSFEESKGILENAAERAIQRRLPDTGKEIINTRFGRIDVSKVVRQVMQTSAFSFLAFSHKIATRSLGYNIFADLMAATSKSVASIGGENEVGGYGVVSLGKSYGKVSVDLVQKILGKVIQSKSENGELIRLALKLQAIEGTESSLNSMWKKVTGKTRITKQEVGHIANQATDIGERIAAMTAMLLENGSLDAYVWDNKTGEHTYDITKDRQYFNEDGSQTDAQKFSLWGKGGLVERLVEQGQMTLEQGQEISPDTIPLKSIPTGYDDKLITMSLKYYIDKYVMASLGEWGRNFLSSVYLGAAFQQYRMFSFEKLFNMGLFAYNRKTEFGKGMEAVQLEDGTWINRHARAEMEGSAQSLAMAQQAINYMMHGEFNKWWSSQPESRRINIVRTMFKGLFTAALIFGLAFGKIPRKDWYKYTFLLSDASMAFLLYDIVSNPFPILGYAQTIIDAITGKRDLTKTALQYTPLRIGYDPYVMFNDFFSEYESQQE